MRSINKRKFRRKKTHTPLNSNSNIQAARNSQQITTDLYQNIEREKVLRKEEKKNKVKVPRKKLVR